MRLLALADRVALMKSGELIQVGTPKEIYSEPNNHFVAEFIGKMNFFRKSIIDNDKFYFLDSSSIPIPKNKVDNPKCVGIRPEDILLQPNDLNIYEFKGKILDIIYHGQENELIIISNISKEPIIVKCHKDQKLDLNSEISLYCENKSFRLY